MTNRSEPDKLEIELRRLGLSLDDLPGLAIADGSEGLSRFIAHLRSLPVGATWHEALPDLPKRWVPGAPETWTTPYRALGPYDHQGLPTSPAVHIAHDGNPPEWTWLAHLVQEARNAGWAIHGAGPVAQDNARMLGHAYVVLERGADQDMLYQFVEWLEGRPNVQIATIPRTGTERYLDERANEPGLGAT